MEVYIPDLDNPVLLSALEHYSILSQTVRANSPRADL